MDILDELSAQPLSCRPFSSTKACTLHTLAFHFTCHTKTKYYFGVVGPVGGGS